MKKFIHLNKRRRRILQGCKMWKLQLYHLFSVPFQKMIPYCKMRRIKVIKFKTTTNEKKRKQRPEV